MNWLLKKKLFFKIKNKKLLPPAYLNCVVFYILDFFKKSDNQTIKENWIPVLLECVTLECTEIYEPKKDLRVDQFVFEYLNSPSGYLFYKVFTTFEEISFCFLFFVHIGSCLDLRNQFYLSTQLLIFLEPQLWAHSLRCVLQNIN